jgi:predicted porin
VLPSAGTYNRSDNTVAYFLPRDIGGFYGTAMVAAGEGKPENGKYVGGRLGWAGSGLDVAVAMATTELDPAGNSKFKVANIGGSYTIGLVKVMAQFHRDQITQPSGVNPTEKGWLLGTQVTVGAGLIRASYTRTSVSNFPVLASTGVNGADLYALGYVYFLSKRAALLATISHLDNQGVGATGGQLAISGGPTPVARGGVSKAAEFGISHSF